MGLTVVSACLPLAVSVACLSPLLYLSPVPSHHICIEPAQVQDLSLVPITIYIWIHKHHLQRLGPGTQTPQIKTYFKHLSSPNLKACHWRHKVEPGKQKGTVLHKDPAMCRSLNGVFSSLLRRTWAQTSWSSPAILAWESKTG